MDEESIFAEAVKIQSDSERQAFLDKVCEGDTRLRAEVEDLLRASMAAGSFLNHPPVNPDLGIDAQSAPEETIDTDMSQISLSFLEPCDKPDRIGKLGVYEIVEVVGRGGMGIVLRAYDTKLRRMVAVKVLAPELAANPMAVKRFLSEAQKAAAVVHDHVVTIHAVDDTHRPPFLVMEYIEGQTLQQKIDREGALQLMPILRIGTQIAEGLAAAHQRGLTHRDVKPANILLENGVERVKIADFGLARATDDVTVTQTGHVAGTPLYMSPEQARGEPVDHRTDLFSLGSVLYAMCTGRPAFRSDSHLAVMRRVCDDAPREIRKVNPEIPEWLVAIIEQLLEKNPEQRFQSAEEVADLLGHHLAQMQTPSQAPPPGPLHSPAPRRPAPGLTPRTHKRMRGLLLAAAITAALVGVVVWMYLPRPPFPGAVQWLKGNGGNGHWYYVVVGTEGITWDEAERKAEAMGGHLVTITSSSEEVFVIRLINDDQYWSRNPDNGAFNGPWIGAMQLEGAREPDGGWRWVTGEPFLYSDWTSGQPNDGSSPYGPQQHIVYHREETEWLSARWGDATGGSPGASYQKCFIVEFDGLSLPKSHPEADPYASLIVDQGPPNINLVIKGERSQQRQTFGEELLTVFVAPGTSEWEVRNGSKVNQRLGGGHIEIRASHRITFTPDGHPPQVLGSDEGETHMVQWPKNEGGNGHKYRVVVKPEGVMWEEAERKAEELGGHLVTITSQAEDDFVIRLINDDRYWKLNKRGPWIGAMQLEGAREPDGGWRWITGERFEYSNWERGQPDDTLSTLPRQPYARYVAHGQDWLSAQWGDASLPMRSFIVEFDDKPILAKDDQPKGDSYGVIFVPTSSKQMALVLYQDIGFHSFHRRIRFDLSHTLFVAPGAYQWTLLDLSQQLESQPIGGGEIKVKAGICIAFTPEGPLLSEHSDGADESPREPLTSGSATDSARPSPLDTPND